jgi:hypothetical protein
MLMLFMLSANHGGKSAKSGAGAENKNAAFPKESGVLFDHDT